jgi:nucleoside-triphosphatase
VGRALLFTGRPRVGKTTAVRRVVERLGIDNCSGFYSLEDRSDGERVGFSIELLDGRVGSLASVYSKSDLRVESVTRPGVSYGLELDFLNNVALSGMRSELTVDPGRLSVIDEIGPMQLYSEPFRDFVLERIALADGILFGSIVHRDFEWTELLKSDERVETFILNISNRATMVEMMSRYLADQLAGRKLVGGAARYRGSSME